MSTYSLLYIQTTNYITNASLQNDNMYTLLEVVLSEYYTLFSQYLNSTTQAGFNVQCQQTNVDLSNLQQNVLNNETTNPQILIYVTNLQSLTVHKYGDINLFLQNNNIKVSYRFSQYSVLAGYPINPGNIA